MMESFDKSDQIDQMSYFETNCSCFYSSMVRLKEKKKIFMLLVNGMTTTHQSINFQSVTRWEVKLW